MITSGIFAGLVWWINPNVLSDLSFRNDYKLVKASWENKEFNVLVEVTGRVALVLPDEHYVTVSQQFLMDLENGHRVLVSHDLKAASRVPVAVSNTVKVRGEFDWTPDGGIIHWTHKDPDGTREGGWIELAGTRYW
jgi:hypothetical protein